MPHEGSIITCRAHIEKFTEYKRNISNFGPVAREADWERAFNHRPQQMSLFEWIKFFLRKKLHLYRIGA